MNKLPLDNIIYEREIPQMKLIFYIRWIKGNRQYSEEIKKIDKRILIGIWDCRKNNKENLPPESVYTWNDQAAMCNAVANVMVKYEEKIKYLKKFLETLEEVYDVQINLKLLNNEVKIRCK
jgi:hypothetical protein